MPWDALTVIVPPRVTPLGFDASVTVTAFVAADTVFPTASCTATWTDRKSTRLNSSHLVISYAVFCLKKKNNPPHIYQYTHGRENHADGDPPRRGHLDKPAHAHTTRRNLVHGTAQVRQRTVGLVPAG